MFSRPCLAAHFRSLPTAPFVFSPVPNGQGFS